MSSVKAHVRNGHFVSDEPVYLPEGTAVNFPVVGVVDAMADMAPDELAKLEESIEEGFRDMESGDHIEARAFMAQLRTKNP
jgi:hypothetical protein